MRRLVAVGLAALLSAGPAAAEGPPAPPPGHDPVALSTGATWTAPDGGGVCLDMPAARYQVEVRAWDEARVRAALELAEARPMKVVVWSAGVGLVVGAAAGAILVARARR